MPVPSFSPLKALAAVASVVVVSAGSLTTAQVPPQVLEMDARKAELAAEAAQRGPAVPIPLIADTSRVVGAVYDQYLLGVAIGRSQIAAGQPVNGGTIAADPIWQSRNTVVIAYALDCDGKPNEPLAIRWTTGMNVPVAPAVMAGPVRGAAAQSLLPGVAVPNDALVVSVRNAVMPAATVEVDYVNPVCRGGARTAMLPLQSVPSSTLARGVNGIRMPEQFSTLPSPSTVRISVTLDTAGRARFPQQVQGPAELGSLAIADLTSKTFPPATVNGIAVPMNHMVPYVYTTTGEPAAAAPYTPQAGPTGMVRVMTGTTRAPVAAAPRPPVAAAPPGFLNAQLARLAAETAAKSDPVPVPLDASGPAVHGVVFDRFLMAVVRARAAFKAGTPIDPATAPATLVQGEVVAVAYPVMCNGNPIAARELAVWIGGTRAGRLQELGPHLTGELLAERLPGVTLPAGAVGRIFASAAFSENLEVRVTYQATPCGAQTPELTFPIQWTRGQALPRMSLAKLPAGSTLPSPTEVRLRGMVDLDGAYRFPSLAEGPPELAVTASVVASSWKFQPYRANGIPSPLSLITTLTFTTSGVPEPLPPGSPARGTPPPAVAPPNVMTSSTVGGRSTTDLSTPDEPGLTLATSRCTVSDDVTYGVTPGNAIAVGGGFASGPTRARLYVTALRGPAGQGLRIIRRGTTMAPDNTTILDLYELSYPGLTAPLRLLVDQYHEAPLRAPQGLTCAVPIAR